MSKNGNLLFREYNPYITSNFGYRIHPISGQKTFHAGVDYGTNNQKLATYAIEEGKVLKIGYSAISGNYVYVNYERLRKNGLYQHLDSIKVKTNQIVNENTIIGYVGKTGQVTGIHLHFGWFDEKDQTKKWNSRNWENFENYNYPKKLTYLGTTTLRDNTKDQIQVLISNLHARDKANGNILGYIKKGIYDILSKEVNGNYTWYLINDGYWIAFDDNWSNLLLKKEITKDNIELTEEKEHKSKKKMTFLTSFMEIFKIISEIILKILKKMKIL